jgi:hypothetical protein
MPELPLPDALDRFLLSMTAGGPRLQNLRRDPGCR